MKKEKFYFLIQVTITIILLGHLQINNLDARSRPDVFSKKCLINHVKKCSILLQTQPDKGFLDYFPLDIRKNFHTATVANLPFSTNSIKSENYKNPPKNFNSFLLRLINSNELTKIFPNVENPDDNFDLLTSQPDSIQKKAFFAPEFVIDTKKHLLIAVVVERVVYREWTIIFIINDKGLVTSYFVAAGSQGNQYHGSTRNSIINKDLTININEDAYTTPNSNEAYYIAKSKWQILPNGKLKKIKENFKFSDDYTQENNNR